MSARNWTSTGTSNLGGALRDQAKRVGHLERRRQITSAEELLGPGFAPSALQVLDWNSDEASYNGYFFSDVGSINSPDGLKAWIGFTVTSGGDDTNESGYQKITSYLDAVPREFRRTWTQGSSGRSYSPWVGDQGWVYGAISLSAGVVASTNRYRVVGETVFIYVTGTIGATLAAALNASTVTTGDYANQQIAAVPTAIIPSVTQPLASGGNGPNFSWAIVGVSGSIFLSAGPVTTAAGGTATFSAATTFSVGGSYLLNG